MKIGIRVDAMGLPLRQALPRAAKLGVGGVQLSAAGDLSPERLGETGRRELKHLLKTNELQLTALNCPLRHGIDEFENQQLRIEHIQRVLTLAFELGARLAIIQCPRLPEGEADAARADRLREALRALGRHGDQVGSSLALAIGFDSGEKVRAYLGTFDSGSLGVDFDPANFMLHGHDPVANLAPLQGKILHVHARDARRVSVSHGAAEVPLGAGDIDWLSFTGTLSAIDFRGWVVIDRESGTNRLADIAAGVEFLKRVRI